MSPLVAHFVSSPQRSDASAVRGEPDTRLARPIPLPPTLTGPRAPYRVSKWLPTPP